MSFRVLSIAYFVTAVTSFSVMAVTYLLVGDDWFHWTPQTIVFWKARSIFSELVSVIALLFGLPVIIGCRPLRGRPLNWCSIALFVACIYVAVMGPGP
jgi:hypothetical protein